VGLTFENPLWLLALILAVPCALVAWRWFVTMSPARRWSAVIARAILITLIALSLAGASRVRTSDRLAVIAVVDASDSIREFADAFASLGVSTTPSGSARWSAAIRNWLAQSAGARSDDDLFGLVVFDAGSIAVLTPTPPSRTRDALRPDDFSLDYRAVQGTDIGAALKFAASLFPPDARRRLVLISDGNETSGNALDAARSLAASSSGSRIPVDVLPIAYRVRNEVMVEAVDAPPQAARQATVTVRVVFNSTDPATGRLDLLYEGQPIDINGPAAGSSRPITLPSGRHVELIDVPLSDATVHRLEPVFTPDSPQMDRLATNNRAQAVTVTPGKGRVLVVDGVSRGGSGPGRTLTDTLARGGIDVVNVGPEGTPGDILSLQAYDLVILQNVAAEELPRRTHESLAEYVQTLGGGLVMVGGPDSFGAGGWKGTALEPVLPVKLDLPEQLVTPSAAIVIVLDSSGSMMQPVAGGARSQQQIANEGAALAVQTLDKTDLVGVIAFNQSDRVIVPLERNTDPKRSADLIRAISPGGGTFLYPAMERAFGMLQGVDAKIKHVIILSDGRSEGDPADGLTIAQRMKDAGISVSTIAVGDEADVQTLRAIATAPKGKFYQVRDPNTLPRVFVKEIRVVRQPLIREGFFAPVDLRSGSPLVAGLNIASMPQLGGLVLTQPRDDPKITYALATRQGEPLLAHWFYARGQVAAFTSDAHNWATRWLDWPGYASMWTSVARTIARPSSNQSLALTSSLQGDDLVVRLDAADDDARPLDALTVNGTIYTPDGKPTQLSLAQTGPGVYEGRVPATDRGTYIIALTPSQGSRPLAPVIGGIARSVGQELRRLSSNVELLRAIAQETGGRVLDLKTPQLADLFTRENVAPQRASMPIWRFLLILATCVFILDVATRRIAWDRLIASEVTTELRRHTAEAVTQRARAAAATIGALRAKVDTPPVPTQGNQPTTPLERPQRPEAPQPLTQQDAEELVRTARAARQAHAAEQRQARLREQMLKRLAKEGEQTPAPKREEPPPQDEPAPDAASSLRAAKRRAREKFENDG